MAEAVLGIEHYLWVRAYGDRTKLLSCGGWKYLGFIEYRRDGATHLCL